MATNPLQDSCQENLDGSITIQGQITIKGTQKAPVGITTVNIKNQWAFAKNITRFLKESSPKNTIAYGENKRVFVNKNGYYKITINKNDTISIIPTPYLYKIPNEITGLTKSQVLNIELETSPIEDIQNFEKNFPTGYNILSHLLQHANPDSLVTVSGTIRNANTGIPLENINIATSFLYNTRGGVSFHFTDQHGQFNIRIPKNSHISVNALQSNNRNFIVKNDTVVNLKL
ncbi:hypothetical protein [Myroides marinus]|uniref:hypothetical protein n=1 Tax=Myroides marinus TaxID=703342 RepID=UPI0025775169|nr:hypothetical protein [Myroides marinus]